jgi:cell division protein FtsL
LIKINPKNALLIVLGAMVIILSLYLPKIYLRNNIYYVSRDINVLHDNYISLKEENRFLQQQLEDMKFKNQIMDSLIINNMSNK